MDVRLVRLVLAGSVLLGGLGALAYLFWWLTLPVEGERPVAGRPVALTRLTRPLAQARARGLRASDIVLALALLAVAATLLASRLVDGAWQSWLIPALLLLTGTMLAWSELGARRGGEGTGRVRTLRLVGGILIAATAIVLLVGQRTEPVVVVQSALAALAVLCGVGLVLAPWWLRLVRELGDARVERERESERADIAAHLHDSVLQTLALIRARSSEPEVVRLARAQERDLRSWLYSDRAPAGTSLATALAEVVAEVEDTRVHADGSAPAIETVVVGDVVPDETTAALLAATREALLNAVVHGAPPVSVYLEADTEAVEVFVRDHGAGFSLERVPSDRLGVRESILGRVQRRGGEAGVHAVAGGGTEVHLRVPLGRSGPGDNGRTARGENGRGPSPEQQGRGTEQQGRGTDQQGRGTDEHRRGGDQQGGNGARQRSNPHRPTAGPATTKESA